MRSSYRILLTGLVVLIAVATTALRYWDYIRNPWTRNGQVRAQVIQIATRVSGPIVDLPIVDNQLVEQGELLFEIAADRKANAQAELLDARASLLQAEATLAKAEANLGAPGEANARLRAAKAAVREAELDLEFTRVTAPVKGYVTNLNLRTGTQAVANQPALALIDVSSFWIDAFFRETTIASIQPGNRAVVTLMSYPEIPIPGHVDSFGRGIAQEDGSTGYNLLPNVSPTFEWIRLAQRIPVRVHLDEVPAAVELLVGSTASVLVMTGTVPDGSAGSAPVPVPKALQ